MAKVITNPIPDLQTSWENYSGESVENFIKDQLKHSCGYVWRSPSKEGDYYYLYGFQSVEDFEKWRDGEEVEVLFKVQLPNLENDTFSANLTTNSNTTKLVNLGSGVKVNLRYTSTSTNPTTGVTVNTYNEGTLVIMRAANGSAYLEVGRETIQPVDFADESLYTQIDVTKYLVDGDNKLRIRVEDKVNGSISTNVIFNSIINTTLKVRNATDLSKPLTSMTLQYYIEGQVAKTLNIKISDTDGVHNYTLPIGESTYLEVPFTAIIDGNFKNGVKNVESWLTVDDTVLESDHITVQFYYINGQSDEGVIILNNVAKEVANYANTHFFDFTLYNKNSDVEITVASGSETYLTYRYTNCLVNTVYSFYNTLEIEATPDYLDAVVTVKTIDHTESYNITIDNSQKMSPTEGANFILNPKSRSNTEANPGTIINEGTDTNEITSTFTGFDFVNDGWASDASGIRVLRIPAGHEVKIGYHPLDMAKLSGTTIELDFRVYNVFNESDTVLKFVDTNDAGFIMNATEAVYYTYENRIKRDQDIVFQDDTRLHVAINIVPNLSGSGINYIRIFINGTLNREMIYENTDLFIQNIENMVIGAPNCDIDIYSIRIYKKGLSAEDVRQDYMSTLPTLEEKIAYRTYNDIVSSNGTISFDKASVKYNTLVWTGKHPEYITGKVKYRGDLSINIIDDLEHSGVLKNMEISGQGSSSRDYWRWNHQYVFKDNSTWINGLGEDMGKYYILSDEDPRCTKLVSKINWASSMQSHKMGTTALYTDLWRKIIGGNSITKTKGYEKTRVSVHEKPFLYFFKDNENSNPVFGGLVTFGSAKGDESTFAGSYTTFPNYLMLEGSDNGMPLPLRLVPWIDSEVSYDSEEDTWNYNGAANWDYVAGNVNRVNYFRDAFNFAYLHSQYLLPYNGTDMNIDYQYWDPTTGRVIRYDYITEDWVDAGITKISSGYSELNIFEQTGISRGSDSDSVLNEKFKKWRADDFKNRLSLYYNVSDTLYTIAFLKLIAGSDNRCKNTYEYLDPNTLKICFAQDDMDTIFATDNVGRKVKPYYVEEHDMNGTSTYWNGENNVFYNLIEAAYGTELRAMMKSILDTMRSSEFGGSVKECMNRYFFSTQDYFPSVAYNETARILYEEASVKQKEGIYKNGTPAISQSLGDQKQAEMQWWKRREKYMQSFASSDPFYIRSAGSLFFRSLLTTQSARPSYQFKLTPWQWLYPKVGSGQSMGSDNTRVQAGTEYTTSTITTDGNTDTFIYGIDYYTKIGEFGDKSIGEAFELSGNRLLEFSADSRKVSSYQFRPTSMTVSCPVLERLCLYGCSTLAGSINLSSCKKLQSLDLRGTNLTSVVLPETETLREVYLPETITTLTVNNCPNLDVNITDYSRLTTVNTDNSNFAMKVIQNANNIETVSFNGINIRTTVQNYQAAYDFILNDNINKNITGEIYLAKEFTDDEIEIFENKFGNGIFNPESSFHLTFITVPINDVVINATSDTLGAGSESTISVSFTGNDVKSFRWTCSSETVEMEQHRKYVVVRAPEVVLVPEVVTITYTLTKTNGYVFTKTVNLTLISCNFYVNGHNIDTPTEMYIPGTGESDVNVQLSISSVPALTNWSIASATCKEGYEMTVDNVGKLIHGNISPGEIGKTYHIDFTINQEGYTYNFTTEVLVKAVNLNITGPKKVQITKSSGAVFEYTLSTDPEYSIDSVFGTITDPETLEVLPGYNVEQDSEQPNKIILTVPAGTEYGTKQVRFGYGCYYDSNMKQLSSYMILDVECINFNPSIEVWYSLPENSDGARIPLCQKTPLIEQANIKLVSNSIPSDETFEIIETTETTSDAYITTFKTMEFSASRRHHIVVKYSFPILKSYDLSYVFAGIQCAERIFVNDIKGITSLDHFACLNTHGTVPATSDYQHLLERIKFTNCSTGLNCSLAYFVNDRKYQRIDFRGLELYINNLDHAFTTSATNPQLIMFKTAHSHVPFNNSCLSTTGLNSIITYSASTLENGGTDIDFSSISTWKVINGAVDVYNGALDQTTNNNDLIVVNDATVPMTINFAGHASNYGSLYYSVNGGERQAVDMNQFTLVMQPNDYVCMRGNWTNPFGNTDSSYLHFTTNAGSGWSFSTNGGAIRFIGYIESLGLPNYTERRNYYKFFANDGGIKWAPDFGIIREDVDINSTYNCYMMYNNCYNLEIGPEYLPMIKSINDYSYTQMFEGCEKLKWAPMYKESDGDKVTSFGTTGGYQFKNMYKGTSIEYAYSTLPTYIDTSGTKREIFMNTFLECRKLYIAPNKLYYNSPSNSSFYSTFYRMFSSTSKLIRGMDIKYSGCNTDIFNNMYSYSGLIDSGNLTRTTSNSVSFYGYEMFKSCTNLRTANFTIKSYNVNTEYMFDGCTNLTNMPEINTLGSALTINGRNMFNGCTSLTSIHNSYIEPISGFGSSCLFEHMFDGCSALSGNINITFNFSTPSESNLCYYMFKGCTGIENATITFKSIGTYSNEYSKKSFEHMFDGCTNLKTARIEQSPLSYKNVPRGAFDYMFQDCPNLNTVYMLFGGNSPSNYPTNFSEFGTSVITNNKLGGKFYYHYDSQSELININSVIPSTWSVYRNA